MSDIDPGKIAEWIALGQTGRESLNRRGISFGKAITRTKSSKILPKPKEHLPN